jgi:hypothetical protein
VLPGAGWSLRFLGEVIFKQGRVVGRGQRAAAGHLWNRLSRGAGELNRKSIRGVEV